MFSLFLGWIQPSFFVVAKGYGAEAKAPEACGVVLVEDTVLVRTKLARCMAVTVQGGDFWR